jgi:3-methylcrotonyl-CoA carboxylase alpha subunit
VGAAKLKVRMFSKILIANRGEIACRIMRTCRRLGVRTVAVYSDADAASLHVRSADEAVYLGASRPQESYLSVVKIIAAAKKTGAESIHPGYGFLSENENFAQACTDAGLTFIGPPASAIRTMGSKSAAKVLMQQAGVPLTPGYHGDNQVPGFLFQQADETGYPLLIKASAGGGGKGMRRVDEPKEFLTALASCKREAAASFGDDRVLIERFIVQPRHIEIQVFADKLGNVIDLFERDCSVQRRHQKVLEEAPAPGMTEPRRAAMSKAACDAARAVGYVGAGTVEFIADQQGNFHFMEMNTRLQVEHPVTEMITGLDLVEWQLRVATGEGLPLTQKQLAIHGHALEARIYAEDPASDFLPWIGKLLYLKAPAQSKHVRIDTGVEQGDEITAFYDPMIAKLIVWDETRDQVLDRMSRALAEFQIVGVLTNVDFLKRLIATSSFRDANLDTGLIEREKEGLLPKASAAPKEACLLAALSVLLRERAASPHANERPSPWALLDGWRLSGSFRRRLQFLEHDDSCVVDVEYRAVRFLMFIAEHRFDIDGELHPDGELIATIDGLRMQATAVSAEDTHHLFFAGQTFVFRLLDPLASEADGGSHESSLLSPMPGLLTMLLAEPGAHVEKGTPLLVMEAMKMEYTIKAPATGKVESFFFGVGDQVPEGTQLLRFEHDSE